MQTDSLLRSGTRRLPRGPLITALARWISFAYGVVALALLWKHPGTRPVPALAVGVAYAAFAVPSHWALRRRPGNRALKAVHDVVDALAIGCGSAFSGGLASPLWLVLYPHVVATSVRGGLAYAWAMGFLDAGIIQVLVRLHPDQLQGSVHSVALLFCALMGGTTSSHLKAVKARLEEANRELSLKNEQLSETVAAHEASRHDQELALERLRDSEERYRRLLERIQDGVLIIQEGRIVYANSIFAAMVGATPEELPGTDFCELVPAEERGDLEDRYRSFEDSKMLVGGFESRIKARDGSVLLVSVKAGSLEFQGKRSVITTIRDITPERQMEQDLKGHAERLAAINEIANAVNLNLNIEDIFSVAAEETRRIVPFDRLTFALLDEDGPGIEVVAVARGAQRQPAAFARDEVAWAFRRPMSWCLGGEDAAPAHVQDLLAEPRVVSAATIPLLSKERIIGSMNLGRMEAQAFSRWDLALVEPVARHIAIALDNARLLEAVRRRSREFESLLEVGEGIMGRLDLAELLPLVTRSVNRVMGTKHCILLLKSGTRLEVAAQEGLEAEVLDALGTLKVGESLSGWVAQEGKPLAVHEIREDPRARFVGIAEQYGYRSFLCVPLKRGAETIGTLEVVTKEPRRFGPEQLELMSTFAVEAAVAIENARLFEEARAHLAQMAEANRRLEDLDRLRQQYLRNVSHEFRTPLTVIKGYAEYLDDTASFGEGHMRDIMRIIVESCDRVIDMVDTLLEVSRVEQVGAEETLHVESLDIREVAALSVEPLKSTAARKGVILDLAFPGEPLEVQGDAGLLYQVVRKLVDNAVKYSGAGGRVVVRGRADGEELTLEVEDSGMGIAAEHLTRIFDKFYMVDGGIARRVGGTGVGLYLVREIVQLHKGTVTVRSAPGKGSVFCVKLPRRFRSAPPQAAYA